MEICKICGDGVLEGEGGELVCDSNESHQMVLIHNPEIHDAGGDCRVCTYLWMDIDADEPAGLQFSIN